MTLTAQRLETAALGLLFVVVLMAGGETAPDAPVAPLLHLLSLLICGVILLTGRRAPVSKGVVVFMALVALVIIAQLVPAPWSLLQKAWPKVVIDAYSVAAKPPDWGFLTLSFDRTLNMAAQAASLMLLFFTLVTRGFAELMTLPLFIAVGVFANAVVAVLQFITGVDPVAGAQILYPVQLGFFANKNHFATMLLMAIPAVVSFGAGRMALLRAAGVVAILLLLLMSGSAAGVGLGVLVTALSVAMQGRPQSFRLVWIVFALVVIGLFAFVALSQFQSRVFFGDFDRIALAKQTIAAYRHTPWFGTGLGTFPLVYQFYETAADIQLFYVNHAHNDFVEIALETGVAGIALMALYLVMVGVRIARFGALTHVRVAGIAIGAALLHSLVDYPTRTVAISALFVFANAVLFHTWTQAGQALRGPANDDVVSSRRRSREPARAGEARGPVHVHEGEISVGPQFSPTALDDPPPSRPKT